MGTNKPEQFTLLLLFVEEGEARVDGGPLAQPGEVAGHEVRGGRGHVCHCGSDSRLWWNAARPPFSNLTLSKEERVKPL